MNNEVLVVSLSTKEKENQYEDIPMTV